MTAMPDMDARDAAEPIMLGTPLRDAAVDPRPTDFLPPTNAGQADPHGPLVVSPQIHASETGPIRPGDVFVDDPARQSAAETALAEAVFVQNQDVGEATQASLASQDDADAAPEKSDDASDGIPASSATKAAWVDFAVAQGLDRDEAEDLTKAEIQERFGES